LIADNGRKKKPRRTHNHHTRQRRSRACLAYFKRLRQAEVLPANPEVVIEVTHTSRMSLAKFRMIKSGIIVTPLTAARVQPVPVGKLTRLRIAANHKTAMTACKVFLTTHSQKAYPYNTAAQLPLFLSSRYAEVPMRKLMAMAVAVAAVCVVVVVDAYADDGYAWGKTKWAMTPEQVAKAVGKKPEFFKKNDKGEDIYILKNYEIGDKKYNVRLVFHNKKLNMVGIGETDGADTLDKCSTIMGSLKDRFGEPINASRGSAVALDWRTAETSVSLKCTKDMLLLTYSPRKKPGKSSF